MTVPRRPREERLHKILARAGVASRRKCEDLIREGRVQVDGQTVQDVGLKLDPLAHRITVDGQEVDVRPQKVYLLLHKPRGYLCTTEDPFGRPTVLDLVDTEERLFPVGRLDQESEGLVLLTNDGELANRLLHPRYGHWREYWVLVEGEPTPRDLDLLRSGIPLEDGPTAPARVKVLSGDEEEVAALLGPGGPGRTALSIKIREGRKRQVRRMLEALGLPVVRLTSSGSAWGGLSVAWAPCAWAACRRASGAPCAPGNCGPSSPRRGWPALARSGANRAAAFPPNAGHLQHVEERISCHDLPPSPLTDQRPPARAPSGTCWPGDLDTFFWIPEQCTGP